MNYYTDHPEIGFYLNHPLMARIVELKEKGFADAKEYSASLSSAAAKDYSASLSATDANNAPASPLSFRRGVGGEAFFPHHRHEQSLAPCESRDETVDGGVEAFEQRSRDVPFGLCGNHDGLGIVCVYYPTDVLFVLLYIKSTGTIY